MTHAVREDRYEFVIISRSLLQMSKTSDKSFRENQNTFLFSNFSFFSKIALFMW
jgi:hypothetical protein